MINATLGEVLAVPIARCCGRRRPASRTATAHAGEPGRDGDSDQVAIGDDARRDPSNVHAPELAQGDGDRNSCRQDTAPGPPDRANQ